MKEWRLGELKEALASMSDDESAVVIKMADSLDNDDTLDITNVEYDDTRGYVVISVDVI